MVRQRDLVQWLDLTFSYCSCCTSSAAFAILPDSLTSQSTHNAGKTHTILATRT